MGQKQTLGGFEELVLLAVAGLRDDAYGVPIRQTVQEKTERFTSIGAIYTTLERLEQKGFVSSRQGDPTPERGGRAKRYFKVEGAGFLALDEAERARRQLRAGVALGALGQQPAGGVA